MLRAATTPCRETRCTLQLSKSTNNGLTFYWPETAAVIGSMLATLQTPSISINTRFMRKRVCLLACPAAPMVKTMGTETWAVWSFTSARRNAAISGSRCQVPRYSPSNRFKAASRPQIGVPRDPQELRGVEKQRFNCLQVVRVLGGHERVDHSPNSCFRVRWLVWTLLEHLGAVSRKYTARESNASEDFL